MVQEDDVLPPATEPPFLSALHRTSCEERHNKSTENNKALLSFSGEETIQTFNGSIYDAVCEVINL